MMTEILATVVADHEYQHDKLPEYDELGADSI
jgi:hypothetical protein